MIDQYNEPVFGYTDSGMETMTLNFNRNGIEMIRNQTTDKRDNLHAVLNYNKIFGKHETALVTGLQTESYERKNVRARRSNPAKTGLTQVDAGTAGIQGDGNLVGLRMFSYFGRLNYSFVGKYLFEANFRADASSRFRKENRWGYFPGFSAGWRLSEEEFIKPMNLFSNLKLRASWGQLGNQSIEGFWPYLSTISQSNSLSYNYNGTLSPGAAVTALVDNTITWETSTSSDIGLEAGFLNGKLNVEAGYFHKVTSGIIVQLPIPQILGGLTAPYENIGKMLNKGIDISADYGNKVRDKDRFGYNVGVNFAYVDNKVTKFQGGNSPDQLFLIREGYSYQTLYGYKVVGIYQSDEEAAEHMRNNGFKPKAGDLKFEDVAVNGQPDGKLDYNDKQALGKTIPPITYGISGNFSYKRFDLNILLQGINGANLFTRNQFTTLELVLQSVTEKWRDAWTPERTNTNIPRLKLDSSWDQSDNSFWVHRSDFLKIKNVQLGYTLPQSISSRLKTEKIYLYANAQNLHTIMWYKGFEGFDPERASNGDGGGVYPVARVFSFGVNVNF
jgi:TonB-linked SusC/RagA family outer membrane protein